MRLPPRGERTSSRRQIRVSTLVRICSILVFVVISVSSSAQATTTTPSDESQFSLALERTFPTVALDEKDLARLTEIISELPKHYGGHVDIQVTSADRQETVKTQTSYAFFLTPDMPRVICCVQVSYYNLSPLMSLQLYIGGRFSFSDAATLTAEGSDSTVVSGVFRELERELESHTVQSGWLLGQASTSGGFLLAIFVVIVLGAISSLVCYALLSLLDGLQIVHVDFTPPSEKGPGLVGFLMFVSFLVGGIWLYSFLRECFPPAQFTGQLSDTGAYKRSWLIWIASGIILPIVVAEIHRQWAKSKEKLASERGDSHRHSHRLG